MATFIKQTLGNFPSMRLVQKKNGQEKFSFIATNNRTALAFLWSVKYFLNKPLKKIR